MRRPLAVAFCALALVSCGTDVPQEAVTTLPTEAPVPIPRPDDKGRVEQAKRDGYVTVPLTISAQLGRDREVEAALTALGATIESRDPRIGYLRAEMPVDKVEETYAVPGVSKVDVEEPLSNRLPEP